MHVQMAGVWVALAACQVCSVLCRRGTCSQGQKVGVIDEVRIKLMVRTCFFYGDGKLAGCPSIPHEWVHSPRWVKVRKDASPRECVACLEQTTLPVTCISQCCALLRL